MLVDELSSGDDVRGTGEQSHCWEGGEDGPLEYGPRASLVHQSSSLCPHSLGCALSHAASDRPMHTLKPTPAPCAELAGMDREVLVRALKLLEDQGRVRCVGLEATGAAGEQVTLHNVIRMAPVMLAAFSPASKWLTDASPAASHPALYLRILTHSLTRPCCLYMHRLFKGDDPSQEGVKFL